ncbi:hypothetical protein EV652_105428 [Kribbella steppae]|uniref:Uncharacterized protein n=1 Tax=Kribbella steppae TaxID=2512223 RepID=A0A4R2HKR2_9ACTN|nr:hypothetical protein EV652_105428 [Kribbella steppae]
MPKLGTETLTGFPGRAGAVLRVSGGKLVRGVVVAFDDGCVGCVGTADVGRRAEELEADEGPAAVVCCRASSASLVLNWR